MKPFHTPTPGTDAEGAQAASGTAQQLFGRIAPRFAELTDEVLFGDIWQRPGLSPRDRSLITLATLVALNRMEQLPFHISRAMDNGVTVEEMSELITHLAFYSGWPCAASALALLEAANCRSDKAEEGTGAVR